MLVNCCRQGMGHLAHNQLAPDAGALQDHMTSPIAAQPALPQLLEGLMICPAILQRWANGLGKESGRGRERRRAWCPCRSLCSAEVTTQVVAPGWHPRPAALCAPAVHS